MANLKQLHVSAARSSYHQAIYIGKCKNILYSHSHTYDYKIYGRDLTLT